MDDFDFMNARDNLPRRNNNDPREESENGENSSDPQDDREHLCQIWDNFPGMVGKTKPKKNNNDNQDYIMYADDTTLLIDKDTDAETNKRLKNYHAVCTSRHLEIQWAKTIYIGKKGNNNNKFNGPFKNINTEKH